MPTPLPDEERRRLVQGLLDRGVPQERIKQLVNQAEGYEPVELNPLAPISVPPSTSAPVTLEEQAAGKEFFAETLPRQAIAAGAGLVTAPFTAGMSLIPAAALEAGMVGGADVLYQGVRKLLDPGRTIKPRESFDIGKSSAVGSGVVRGGLTTLQRLSGRIGGIPRQALTEVLEKAPAGGRESAKMIRVPPQDAEYQLNVSAQASAAKQRAPSLPEAEKAIAEYPGEVDSTPIFEMILSRYRQNPVNAAEESANKSLEDLAGRLPQSMTMVELEEYLRRIRAPIKDRIGREGGSLAAQDVKDVQAFVRQYRDQLLTASGQVKGVEAFARSSEEIAAIKKFKKLLLEPGGDLKRSVENTVRRLPSNRVIMNVFDRYDQVAGTSFAKQARELALKRAWNPSDYKDAGALTEILTSLSTGTTAASRIGTPGARGTAKFITVATPPRGLPRVAAGVYAGTRKAKEEEEKRIKKERDRIRSVGPNP